MKLIVFFDDTCSLCRNSVNFLHKHDKHRRLHFASLEGKTARKHLTKRFRTMNSIVFLELPSGRLSSRGKAVFTILGKLGGLWILASWMHYLPFIDSLYRLIAHRRKRGGALPKPRVKLLP
jgi:predicted DCC family thiol-disulfide oxidoreductase YuxK